MQKPTRHIGGSILPSNNPQILQPIPSKHGTLQVRPLPELDTHALFLGGQLLASHPNGYSCHALAARILKAWEERRIESTIAATEHAMEQFDYILRCGGVGIARDSLERIVNGAAFQEA